MPSAVRLSAAPSFSPASLPPGKSFIPPHPGFMPTPNLHMGPMPQPHPPPHPGPMPHPPPHSPPHPPPHPPPHHFPNHRPVQRWGWRGWGYGWPWGYYWVYIQDPCVQARNAYLAWNQSEMLGFPGYSQALKNQFEFLLFSSCVEASSSYIAWRRALAYGLPLQEVLALKAYFESVLFRGFF